MLPDKVPSHPTIASLSAVWWGIAAAIKNSVTGYYIIDCMDIKRKEIKILSRSPEVEYERYNYRELVGTKKPQGSTCHRLGAFVLLMFRAAEDVTNAPDKTPHNQSTRGLSDFLHRRDTANPHAVSFS